MKTLEQGMQEVHACRHMHVPNSLTFNIRRSIVNVRSYLVKAKVLPKKLNEEKQVTGRSFLNNDLIPASYGLQWHPRE